jgi:AraC family transcriptional regulator, regulatory protein of adaptative response / DNA-3-methyladenine glycosylase II
VVVPSKRARCRIAAGLVSENLVELTLPVGRPFHTESLLAYLRIREIEGVEEVNGLRYRRSIRGREGAAVLTVDFTLAAEDGHVSAWCPTGLGIDLESLTEMVTNLVDADAPVDAIAERLGADPIVGPLVRMYPGIRIPGTVEPFELAVRAILGQQVSVAAAATLASRVAAGWGSDLASTVGRICRTFPAPERLAEAPLERIGLSRARAGAVRGLATAIAGGELELRPNHLKMGVAEQSLLALVGIGPWTASYISVRGLRNRNAVPVGDLGLRQALGFRETREVAERAKDWEPWGAYAAVYLWSTFLLLSDPP